RTCGQAASGRRSSPRKSLRRPDSFCWWEKKASARGRCSNMTRRSIGGGALPPFPSRWCFLRAGARPARPFLRRGSRSRGPPPDPPPETSPARLLDSASGQDAAPGELWRSSSPYRGLAAMTEAGSDFFFGRARETIEVLTALSAGLGALLPGSPHSRPLPVLLG